MSKNYLNGLHYSLTGNQNADTCLFFIHGFACSENDWHKQIAYFKADYQLLTCSLRGHGSSRSAKDQRYDIPVLANDIALLLDHLQLNKKIVLIGHSMGTRVVIELNYLRPNLISKMVLIDCGYSPVANPDFNVLQQRLFSQGFQKQMIQIFNSMFVESTSQKVRDYVLNSITSVSEDAGKKILPNTYIYDYYATEKTMKLVKVPILAVQSTIKTEEKRTPIADINNRGESPWLDLLESLPNATVKLVANCGHFIMLEQPDMVNELLDNFIKS